MPTSNIFTEATLGIINELKTMRKEAAKSQPVPPFMAERVPLQTAYKRFQAMPEESKRKFIEQVGLDNVLSMVRRATKGKDLREGSLIAPRISTPFGEPRHIE